MKKIYSLAAVLCFSMVAFAQTNTEDFESYTVGNFLGNESTTWTTWSGSNGGADDVLIVDDTATW